MTWTLRFWVPGLPAPQGSMKGFVRGGRVVMTSANPRVHPWRQGVAVACEEAADKIPALTPPYGGPVFVGVAFYLPRPASHYGKTGLRPSAPAFPGVKPDLDKLARAVLDGMCSDYNLLTDDSRVVVLQAAKHYCRDGEAPGCSVVVYPEA